jgi:protein O-GlcNAc transferase
MDAETAYLEVLRVNPDQPHALHLLGVVLSHTGRAAEGAERVKHSLTLLPEQPNAHASLGNALVQQGLLAEALDHYDRALRLEPRTLTALIGRGQILLERGSNEAALASLDAALRLQPDEATALFLRGRALSQLGRPAEAGRCFQRVYDINPRYEYLLGAHFWTLLHACLWSEHTAQTARIEAAVRNGNAAAFPFVFLSVCDSPDLQLRCAREFAARHRPNAAPVWRGERYRHDRIRIAYISEDFRSHPTSYLMMDLLECHDRRRFEITAVSLRPAEDSQVGRRVQAAFDHFVDAGTKHDAEIARCMRSMEIDIAVDLMGYTGGRLHTVLAHRPAPLQVNYLGYPGTLGSVDADYLIADEFLIPRCAQQHFSEQIVYLPGSYQPNDRQRSMPQKPSRAQSGLPENAFVWCCFNNAYKFNPLLFDIWCRLLAQVPDSVLWLIPGSKEAEKNLQLEAAARGIDSGRLVFASNLPNADHLARIANADLCLDTAPVNGATTTSDALWAGVPVLTCAGRSFVSRMAGSLLSALGLDELITQTHQEYEQLALSLAREPQRLILLRAKVRERRANGRLFDTSLTARHLESAYLRMWELQQQGIPAEGFCVPDLRCEAS